MADICISASKHYHFTFSIHSNTVLQPVQSPDYKANSLSNVYHCTLKQHGLKVQIFLEINIPCLRWSHRDSLQTLLFCTRDGLAAIQLRKEVNRCSCLHLTITHHHLSVMDLLFSPCNYSAHHWDHCKYSTQMLSLNTIYV